MSHPSCFSGGLHMWRRVVVVGWCGVVMACGPVTPGLEMCRIDSDCAGSLVCRSEICVQRTEEDDGGALSPSDAGTVTDAGSGMDAGPGADAGPIDAGSDAGTRGDAGSPGDAGTCRPTSSIELCNGLDDDCDGLIDEQAVVVNLDGGLVPFDGGAGATDGTCTLGVGACAGSGVTTCVSGQLSCDAVVRPAGTETCNGLDDDCDGQTDEAGPGLCSALGQSCVNAACACPSGQTVCGASCVTLGGSCTVGLGICARTGTDVCTSGGAVACSVAPGAPAAEICNGSDDDCDGQIDEVGAGLCPSQGQLCTNATCACPAGQQVCNGACKVLTAEVCDGLDNDCNGQIDEGVTVTCVPDEDNDRYATNGTTSQRCPASNRAAFGNCPVGYVSPSTSLGTDCNGTNAAVYQLILSRNDADGDTYCAGPVANDCAGAGPLAGRRAYGNCAATDDCNDAVASVYRVVASRADADGDLHCAGAITNDCVGATALPGRRFSVSCVAGDDCDDTDGAIDHLDSFRVDQDLDTYCVGSPFQRCVGATAPPGLRYTGQCAATDDCKDTNSGATVSCNLTAYYQTQYRQQTCPGPGMLTNYSVIAVQWCPAGFNMGPPREERAANSDTALCQAINATTIAQRCEFLAGSTCRVVADCTAN